MNGFIVNAKDLRDKENLDKIPHDLPGYYIWWAKKEDFERIARKLNFDFPMECFHIQNGYIAIYIGIAAREAIADRLHWHIHTKHTLGRIQYRTLSTFRHSISSLFGKDMMDEKITNEFIDRLRVEYFLMDDPMDDSKRYKKRNQGPTYQKLHQIECDEMKQYFYPLNIMDNHFSKDKNGKEDEEVKEVKRLLREKRKEAWEKALHTSEE